MKHYIVIGAGISGLATAWFLKQRFGATVKITILEKEERSGGWIKTVQREGFLFDTGPRSCRTRGSGQATLQLLEALGLQDEIIPCSPEARHRYLFTQGHLKRLPSSLLGACLSPLTRRFLPLLWKERNIPPANLADETIASFMTRRFSKAFAEELFDPLTLGIYAGNSHALSFPSCFPEFANHEKHYGSLVRALWQQKREKNQKMNQFPIITLKGGMEILTRSLGHALKEHLVLNTPVLSISPSESGIVVKTSQKQLAADHVYVCTPAHAIPHFIPPLAEPLKQFSTATVAAVHLGWNKSVLTKRGFGYLVPTKENEPILGVIFDSSVFPQQNQHEKQTRLTVMLGGTVGVPVVEMSDDALIALSKKSLYKHLGLQQPPHVAFVSRAINAIPQYTLGHQSRVTALNEEIDSLFHSKVTLMGSSWNGVSVNDCIQESYERGRF